MTVLKYNQVLLSEVSKSEGVTETFDLNTWYEVRTLSKQRKTDAVDI